jgi:hypothetical protein
MKCAITPGKDNARVVPNDPRFSAQKMSNTPPIHHRRDNARVVSNDPRHYPRVSADIQTRAHLCRPLM